MFRRARIAVTNLLIVIPLITLSNHAHAQMKVNEGVEVNVIAEIPSDVPGLEKVRILRVIMQPGAGWTEITQFVEEYCTLTQGTLTSTDFTAGVTTVYSAGSWWSPRKDHIYTTFNTGKDVVDMLVLQLVQKETAN